MREVIGALVDRGDEFVPLATALRRLVESGELKRKPGGKRSSSTTAAVWPHKLMDGDAAAAASPVVLQHPPQTAPPGQPHAGPRQEAGAEAHGGELAVASAMADDEDEVALARRVAPSEPAAVGTRFDSLFRTQSGGLAARVAEVSRAIPSLPIDSLIDDLASADDAAEKARAIDASFAAQVPAGVSAELQRLLDLSSQASELHPRTVQSIVKGAHATSGALRRAQVYLARSLAQAPQAPAADEPAALAALHSLVAGSTADLLDGLINVARVTAASLARYREEYDRSEQLIGEVVRERDDLKARLRRHEADVA